MTAALGSTLAKPRHFVLHDKVRVSLPNRTTIEGEVVGVTYAYPAFDVLVETRYGAEIMHDVEPEKMERIET